MSVLFDKPANTLKVTQSGGEITCTYYTDAMVREVGTDSPAPGAATIVPSPPQKCEAARGAHDIPLKTAGYTLMGRKGGYVFFSATDPNGAVPFSILEASSGRAIYTDSSTGGGWQYVGFDNGSLHIKFTRAVNGSCSIVKDGAQCWARITRESSFPKVIAQAPAPIAQCTADYKKDKSAAGDFTMIIYDVDLSIDAGGHPQVNSRGPIRCGTVP